MFSVARGRSAFCAADPAVRNKSQQKWRNRMVNAKKRVLPRGLSIASVGLLSLSTLVSAQQVQHYKQTNLVSDTAGTATVTDPNLVNPWGLSRSSGSPWWVSDNGTGRATLYGATGTPASIVVT